MLEEGVYGHEAVTTSDRPEIVCGKHGDRGQHAETPGPQPDPASDNYQRGAAEFDDDGRSGPEPSGLEAEMRLLRGGRRKIGELLDTADQEGRDQRNPGGRQKPRPRKNDRYPAWGSLFDRIKPPSRRSRARPKSS